VAGGLAELIEAIRGAARSTYLPVTRIAQTVTPVSSKTRHRPLAFGPKIAA
jgi:hypothetical protein